MTRRIAWRIVGTDILKLIVVTLAVPLAPLWIPGMVIADQLRKLYLRWTVAP